MSDPSPTRRPARRRSGAGCLALVAMVLAGCGGMPTSGPITEVDTANTVNADPGVYFDPKPPQRGESAFEIVNHFLEAMKATPTTTSVAAKFLTSEARRTWTPERSIITYQDIGDPSGFGDVSLSMEGVAHYDHRGAWLVDRARQDLDLHLVQEDGEWRIDRLPDALIVPAGWFNSVFQRMSLFYFDPAGEILVPEPVFVPGGDQQATALARGLLHDPTADPQLIRNYMPADVREGLSVPISGSGIADVTLVGSPGPIDEATSQRILTQMVWTLRQHERVRALHLTIGDQEIGLPNGATQVNLDVGQAFDPSGASASTDVFGIVGGRVQRGELGSMRATAGPMGLQRLGIRSIGVDLDADRVAAVSQDGTRLLVAPVDVEGTAEEVVSGATNLLGPMWDFKGRVWVVDRNQGDARVLLISGSRVRQIRVPGITGRNVTRTLVSRDGGRLVAVVRDWRGGVRGDRVVASRIRRAEDGRVLGATPSVELDTGSGTGTDVVRDIGWRSPTSVSVLMDSTADLSTISTVSVDGAPGELPVVGATVLRGAVRQLATSPDPAVPVLAYRGERVVNLTSPQRALTPPPQGTTFLTYVG